MLPGDVRGVVCQSFDAGSTYQCFRGKIRNLVSHRVSMRDPGPSPVDVGAVGGDYAEGEVE